MSHPHCADLCGNASSTNESSVAVLNGTSLTPNLMVQNLVIGGGMHRESVLRNHSSLIKILLLRLKQVYGLHKKNYNFIFNCCSSVCLSTVEVKFFMLYFLIYINKDPERNLLPMFANYFFSTKQRNKIKYFRILFENRSSLGI